MNSSFSGPSRKMRAVSALGLTIVTLALGGCVAARGKVSTAKIAAPPSWSSSAGDTGPEATGDLSHWWQRLSDPVLSQLVDEALKASPDLRSAQARLRQARAQRGLAGANRLPTVTASGGAAGSGNTSSGSATTGLFQTGFDASWEPDVFGGQRSAVKASQADLEATAEDLRNTQVSLVAEVALNYVELRAFQSRLEIANRNAASQAETLQLAQWREQAGLVGAVDVEQARTNLEQTKAQIPSLETSIAQSQHRLAILAGLEPGALKQQLSAVTAIPQAPEQVSVGIPAETLRQRPDVRAAERRVEAETARVAQANAARYPSFSLKGSIGTETITGVLSGGTSLVSSIAGSLAQTIFDGGKIRQQIEIQSAVQEQAVVSYESTVLTALEDVENALIAYQKSKDRLASLNTAAVSARNAESLATNRYTAGLSDFQTVLDTQRTVLTVEDSIATTQAERASAVIQLYKALGGGWSSDPGGKKQGIQQ